MKKILLLLVALFFGYFSYSQNWSAWESISNSYPDIKIRYKCSPCAGSSKCAAYVIQLKNDGNTKAEVKITYAPCKECKQSSVATWYLKPGQGDGNDYQTFNDIDCGHFWWFVKSIQSNSNNSTLNNSSGTDKNSPDEKSYCNRGYAKHNLGDYRGAIQDYNKAIQLNPDYANAYYNRGIAKARLGDYRGAIQDYNKAIQLNPDDAEAYNNRGGAKFLLGDKNGACLDWSKAWELGNLNAYDFIKKYCN